MSRTTISITLFSLLILCAENAFADWTISDGHKMHFPQMPDDQGWLVKSGLPVILAEDWQCNDSGWIKDLHFWGGWKAGNEGIISHFLVSIYADIPINMPDTFFSRPGAALWSKTISNFIVDGPFVGADSFYWFDPSTGIFSPDDSLEYYQYNIFLDEPDWFWQEEGTIYWLSVSALVINPETYEWGWISALENWNDEAVWTYPDFLWYYIVEPPGYPAYVPGDVNGNCVVDSNDVNHLVAYIQMTGPPPRLVVIDSVGADFYPAADANGTCSINSIDVTYLIMYLDHGGPSPQYCPLYLPEGSGPSLDLAFVINGGSAEAIPTLSEWGMLILVLLLLAAGTAGIIRRKRSRLKNVIVNE